MPRRSRPPPAAEAAAARCSGGRCRGCGASSRGWRSTPLRRASLSPAPPDGPRDRPRPRHHRHRIRPQGAGRPLLVAALGGGGRREGRDEGDRRVERRAPLDLRVVPPESYGNLLQHFTGSKDHNVALREERCAAALGLRVRGHRRRVAARCTLAIEEDVYAFLGYDWIRRSCARTAASWWPRGGTSSPSSSRSPICAATCTRTPTGRTGRTRSRRWSPAQARGYAYYAICDHSHRLRDGRLEQQAAAIDALNEQRAPFRILKGIEVEHSRGRHARHG